MNIEVFDGLCVRRYRTFRSMLWTQRVLALSFLLSPILISGAAFLPKGDDTLDGIWPALAVVFWVISALDVLIYLRGLLADRQGTLPTPPKKRPDLKLQRELLIGFLAVICLSVFSLTVIKRSIPHDWKFLFLFAAVFFSQLAAYTHNVLENARTGDSGAASQSL